jgi:putative tryptophan/tyrosine transport system substrate-binding protein
MRRREFITLLGAAAFAWPLAARAQDRVQRIGVLVGAAADDPDVRARLAAFAQRLKDLGWEDGRNVRIEYRSGAGDPDRIRKHIAELLALVPDVILTSGTTTMGPLLQATNTVPIVFTNVADPVGAGLVQSLARPGGNVTGFVQFEYGISAKWLELLKQVAPYVTRAAVVRDPAITAGIGQWGAIQTAVPSLGIEPTPVNVRDAGELERAIAAFARDPHGGLIRTASAWSAVRRNLVATLAARHKLPAVYYRRTDGGLISYGPDIIDQFKHAAGYVHRILRGDKPADLPVQMPTKYELVINLKTAKALGLEIPPTLLAIADEVIE